MKGRKTLALILALLLALTLLSGCGTAAAPSVQPPEEEERALDPAGEQDSPDAAEAETELVRSAWQQVRVPEPVLGYIMDIIQGTRNESSFVTGISTRGAQALYRGCQAYAAVKGRDYVIPEDVQYLAPFILCHRLSSGSGTTDQAKEFLLRVIGKVQVPLETV